MRTFYFLLFIGCLYACNSKPLKKTSSHQSKQYITVLGIAQDAGYPHIGCQKQCCVDYYSGKRKRQKVTALGLIDLEQQQKWLFEASPDISTQLAVLEQEHLKTITIIDGVFLTHAHIGHYSGLMYFGREALGKKNTKVYAMPKMRKFLRENGPWSQLINLQNIVLQHLQHDSTITLNKNLQVTPFLVPHRDEFSETVGYKITGKSKSALFIPDIDKWQKWHRNIIEEVKKVDYAFLDATFFNQHEVKRAMTEVPHPFIQETVELFKHTSLETKHKVIFIHFNHTNPVLQKGTKEKNALLKLGFRFAEEGTQFPL